MDLPLRHFFLGSSGHGSVPIPQSLQLDGLMPQLCKRPNTIARFTILLSQRLQ